MNDEFVFFWIILGIAVVIVIVGWVVLLKCSKKVIGGFIMAFGLSLMEFTLVNGSSEDNFEVGNLIIKFLGHFISFASGLLLIPYVSDDMKKCLIKMHDKLCVRIDVLRKNLKGDR